MPVLMGIVCEPRHFKVQEGRVVTGLILKVGLVLTIKIIFHRLCNLRVTISTVLAMAEYTNIPLTRLAVTITVSQTLAVMVILTPSPVVQEH
jgi:hypothetical protein